MIMPDAAMGGGGEDAADGEGRARSTIGTRDEDVAVVEANFCDVGAEHRTGDNEVHLRQHAAAVVEEEGNGANDAVFAGEMMPAEPPKCMARLTSGMGATAGLGFGSGAEGRA